MGPDTVRLCEPHVGVSCAFQEGTCSARTAWGTDAFLSHLLGDAPPPMGWHMEPFSAADTQQLLLAVGPVAYLPVTWTLPPGCVFSTR